jgi:hypothetical protein
VAQKMAEKQARYDQERETKKLARDKEIAERNEMKRRADLYPELLEALKDAAEAFEILANGGSVDAHQAAQILRSDIAKAEGV